MLLEFPLYRLRKRIDVVILTGSAIVVIETKYGETEFRIADERQVEEYALDLRDFHAESRERLIVPVLWATAASIQAEYFCPGESIVSPVVRIGNDGLAALLSHVATLTGPVMVAENWDRGAYRLVPSIVEAATTALVVTAFRPLPSGGRLESRCHIEANCRAISEAKRQSWRRFLRSRDRGARLNSNTRLSKDLNGPSRGAHREGNKLGMFYLSGNTPLA